MTSDALRLMLAAKLIRRIDAVGDIAEYEGETLSDIAWACSQAAARQQMGEAFAEEMAESPDHPGYSVKVESSSNVVPLRSAVDTRCVP